MPPAYRQLDKAALPHGGWRYTFPGTECEIIASTREGLIRATRRFMEMEGIPIPDDLAELLEEMLCARMPPLAAVAYCRWPGEPIQAHVDYQDVFRFLAVVEKWLTESREFVPLDEATRRGAICGQCPQNVPVTGCSACKGLISRLMTVVAGRSTVVDYRLQSCAVCKCANRAQIHVPLEVLHTGISKEMGDVFPSWCWKKPVRCHHIVT